MYIKQGDTAPPLIIDTNADLTSISSAVAKIRRIHQSTVMSKTLTVTDATNGILQYDWIAGDTDTPGTYLVDAVVTFSNGKVERFPQSSSLEVVIKPKVG